MNRQLLINLIKDYFRDIPEDQLRTQLTNYGIEPDNIDKLITMLSPPQPSAQAEE